MSGAAPAGDPVILCVGSINVDLQVRSAGWPEPGGAAPALDYLRAGGGKAANRALAAHRCGGRSVLIGCVGDDDLADVALAALRREEVALDVAHKDGQPTGVAFVVVDPSGDKRIVFAANANQGWSIEDVARTLAAMGKAPARSIVTLDLEAPDPAIDAVLEDARRRRLPVLLDPSPADRASDARLARVDYLTPNPGEARALTGVAVRDEDDAMRAGRALVARGVGCVLVKLPGGGCVVASAKRAHVLRPPWVDVVDTTGAGDAFAAALAVGLCSGRDILESAQLAVAASTLAVTVYGAQPSLPSRSDVDGMARRVDVRALLGRAVQETARPR